MEQIIGYKCKHCGRAKSEHLANNRACRIKGGSRLFPVYSTAQFYEIDTSKPIFGWVL